MMPEERGEYIPEDEAAVIARLREVLTLGQMLKLAELLSAIAGQRFGSVRIIVRDKRVLFEPTPSIDGGLAVWVDQERY